MSGQDDPKNILNIVRGHVGLAAGIVITVGFGGLFLYVSFFIQSQRPSAIHTGLALALLLLTIIWFWIYYWSASNEMNLLATYVGLAWMPMIRDRHALLILALAVLFGVLIAAVYLPIVYCSIAVLLLLFDFAGDYMVMRSVLDASLRGSDRQPQVVSAGVTVLRRYYFDNPTLIRDLVVILAFGSSLLVAVVHHYTRHPPILWATYGLTLATITVSEITISRWRGRRDDELEEILAASDGAEDDEQSN